MKNIAGADMDAIEYLKSRNQWVAWKSVLRKGGGKPTKPPVDANTGKAAKVNEEGTWSSYAKALARKEKDNLAGVGYVLTKEDNLIGGDLDHVRDSATGKLVDWVAELVGELGTYAEISPSGTGIRIFWRGTLPKAIKNDKMNVELYTEGRYLTITENHLAGTPMELGNGEGNPALLKLIARAGGEEQQEEVAGVVEINDWHKLNATALGNMKPWVPHLFGSMAKPTGDGGYRVSSKSLGRNLQEDLSLSAEGIVDFGIADQGDPRQGKRTPINLVMEHKGILFNDAVKWLCERLGVAKPTILLSPGTPYLSAKEMMRCLYTTEDAIRLLQRHRGTYWLHEKGRYQLITDERLKNSVWRFLDEANKTVQEGKKFKTVAFSPKTANVSDVASACNSVCELDDFITPPSWLNNMDMPPAEEFMSFANGLLHIPSGELYPHTPSFFGVFGSAVEYNADAPPPVHWLKFLDETLEDPETIRALQEWMGYTLTPDTSQQKILMGIGPRRSGKGTVARIHTALLGTDSVGGPTMSSLGENFGLEPLITKSLAIISDARLSGRVDRSGIVERLLSISGEDTMTVPRKFLPAWAGRLPTRFSILTNVLPALVDDSSALAGRFLIIEFRRSFYGKEDTGLTKRLLAEMTGILNWAIEGYKRLKDRGHFVQPKNSAGLMEQLETLGSPVKSFVEDRCVVGPGNEVEVDLLYARWREWCESEGRTGQLVYTKEWFSRDLRAAVLGVGIIRRRVKGRRLSAYSGIGLVDNPDEVI